MREPTRHTMETGSSTFQQTYIIWSSRTLGMVQRIHICTKTTPIAFETSTTNFSRKPKVAARRDDSSPRPMLSRKGIPVHQPESLRTPDARNLLAGLAPDLLIVVAYGLILPRELLELPTFGCWNIHASLLPRWRGAAPIQRAIEAGDEETGVCIMQMDEGLDTGALLQCARIPLDGTETAGSPTTESTCRNAPQST